MIRELDLNDGERVMLADIEKYALAFGIEQRAEWARGLARDVDHGLGR